MRIIYYKNGRLNKTKTCISLVKYHLSDIFHGRELSKIVTERSDLST